MHDGIAIAREVLPHIFNNLIIVLVGTSKFLASLDVFDLCLLSLNPAKSVAMSSIEIRLLAISFQTNGIRIQRMKPSKGFDGREPADNTPCQQYNGKLLALFEMTYACLRSEGDSSPRSGSVIIRPLTNSIT